MSITRESILRDRLDMARHNLHCYSANYLCTTPKEGFEKEYKDCVAEVKILEEWLKEIKDNAPEAVIYIMFQVKEWRNDEEGEYETSIDVMKAVSEYHAKALLRDGIKRGKYPKGAWLTYLLNGKTIELDVSGRIA